MDELESRQSVDFEQVVVERRRRLDPLVIGPILVAIAVIIGVAWPDEPAPPVPTTAPDATSGPLTSAVPSLDGQVPGLDPQGTAKAESVALRLQNLGAWGIRTYELVDGSIERRWQPVEPGEGTIAPILVVDSPSIVLIEVTSPRDLDPLDVRVWRRGAFGRLDWLDTGWPMSAQPAGRVLLRPPVVNRRWLTAWPSGQYRLDLLLGERVARIDLTIDRNAPTRDRPISDWSVPTLRGAPAWEDEPPVGPFAIVRGIGRPLRAAPTDALDIAAAWRAPDQVVARDWIPAATGLGAILPVGAREPQVVLRRLAPEVFLAPDPVAWSLGGAADAPDVAVRFEARPRDRIHPGVYAIDASWTGPSGPGAATWTIELLPARATSTPPLLDTLRLARDLEGRDGIVRDGSFGAGPANRWIEPLTMADGCDPASAEPIVAIVLTGPEDEVVDTVRIVRSESGPPAARSVRLVRPAPGITIVYPEHAFAFLPGDHTVAVEGSEPRTLRFCATGGPPGGSG